MAQKKKKYPKRPSNSASIEVWQRWEKRAAVVKKHNDQIDRDKAAKTKIANKYR